MRALLALGLALAAAAQAYLTTQVSLAAGKDASTEVAVVWLTDDPRDDDASCQETSPCVVFGPLPSATAPCPSEGTSTVGKCSRYDFHASPSTYGNYTSGRIHKARMSGLEPLSWYCYTCGNFGEMRRFRTTAASVAPAPGQPDSRFPFVFGVVGDLGQTEFSNETVSHMESEDVDLILHAGDLSYADSEGPRWDSYMELLERLASKKQWMVCAGDHEVEFDFFSGVPFIPYESRMVMPEVKPGELPTSTDMVNCTHYWPPRTPGPKLSCGPTVYTGKYDWGNSFYSFTSGPAKVVVLNCYAETFIGSAQYNWTKQELESAQSQRSGTPWLIVMMHCPFYNSNKDHYAEMQTVLMRDAHGFEELFHQNNVSVVLAAHVHAYERSYPVYGNRTTRTGPVYITVGDGGNREGLATGWFQSPSPSWSAFHNATSYGHGRLTIANETHMKWEWLTNSGKEGPGAFAARAAEDSIWIFNPFFVPAIAAPEQVTLASGTDAASAIALSWLTDDPRDDAASCSVVTAVEIFGPAEESNGTCPTSVYAEFTAAGTCTRYSYTAAPTTFGNYTSGRIHKVRVSGLEASKLYCYRLAGDPEGKLRSFRTLPRSQVAAAGAPDLRYPVAFGVVGDLGQTNFSNETIAHLDHEEIQMVLHAGDLSYADSNGPRWDSYMRLVEPVASRLQWMVSPGNHEIEFDYASGAAFQPYEHRMVMPEVFAAQLPNSTNQRHCAWPSGDVECTPSVWTGTYDWGNSYFSFTAGPAKVLVLNCYAETHPNSWQYMWAKSELEALSASRLATPWLIVMMHCPFYSSNKDHFGEGQTVLMRDAHGFEDLFMEHNVSVVFAGHVHDYERSFPVYKNQSVAGAPTYITIGDGGNREGRAKEFWDQPPYTWSAFRNGSSYGHGLLTLVNDTHMRWDWMTNVLVDREGELLAEDAGKKEQGFVRTSLRRLEKRAPSDSVWILNPFTAAPTPGPSPGGDEDLTPLSRILICGAVSGSVALFGGLVAFLTRQKGRPEEPDLLRGQGASLAA